MIDVEALVLCGCGACGVAEIRLLVWNLLGTSAACQPMYGGVLFETERVFCFGRAIFCVIISLPERAQLFIPAAVL